MGADEGPAAGGAEAGTVDPVGTGVGADNGCTSSQAFSEGLAAPCCLSFQYSVFPRCIDCIGAHDVSLVIGDRLNMVSRHSHLLRFAVQRNLCNLGVKALDHGNY